MVNQAKIGTPLDWHVNKRAGILFVDWLTVTSFFPTPDIEGLLNTFLIPVQNLDLNSEPLWYFIQRDG